MPVVSVKFPGPVREDVPLAGFTTLEVGGPARYYAEATRPEELAAWFGAARRAGIPVFLLGGGSNLLVSDQGFDGLVVRYTDTSLTFESLGEGRVLLKCGAGAVWDTLVEQAVAEELAGCECLSGIPGLVGAAPIQNIGAYGQEIAEVLEAVHALDRTTGAEVCFSNRDCRFAYRTSRFKGLWKDRYAVLRVDIVLRRKGRPTVRYPDLERRLAGTRPTLEQVRRTVLEVRRSKSMVYDREDPNHRSAGSFFLNPVVPEGIARRLQRPGMPVWPAGPGKAKLSAAWLIEQAGFHKGYTLGRAGLSTNHVLAIVNRGGASAREIAALAGRLRRRVAEAFEGLTLEPEPTFLGFSRPADQLLEEGEP